EFMGAGLVVEFACQERRRDRPFGEVVHALKATTLATDDGTQVQEPLGGDLHLRPVPPLTALLGAAKFPRRQRAFVAQSGRPVSAAALVIDELMPAEAPRGAGSARGAEGGPQLERQDAGGVGPVLERRAPWPPVG